MREYRLYCLRPDGRIKDRHDFEASDDQTALATATVCPDGNGAELWQGARRLATVSGGREPA